MVPAWPLVESRVLALADDEFSERLDTESDAAMPNSEAAAGEAAKVPSTEVESTSMGSDN